VTALHRHQIVWLSPAGWQRILLRNSDRTQGECLEHWAANGFPLVVTKQSSDDQQVDAISLGLPAPDRWGRRRIALRVPRRDVLFFDEFPKFEEVLSLVHRDARAEGLQVVDELRSCGVFARVYGSLGWQHLTGLDHVRTNSDVDLWMAVSDLNQADAVARVLQACAHPRLALDGELMFNDGHSVAWREWLAWRAGHSKSLLVRTLSRVFMSRTFDCPVALGGPVSSG
jgi:phosphoribosyl-dephospho-CoA transferase